MSLRQIAQNLGLSITTVSRALAGYSDVSATTRQRVQSEAERIHYVPNEVARRLQRGRADALGFVVPGNHGFDDLFSSTSSRASGRGSATAASTSWSWPPPKARARRGPIVGWSRGDGSTG